MREIEFRGKRVDNGEWVYGDFVEGYFIKNDRKCYIIEKENLCECNEYKCFGTSQAFEVIPETIGQYTGLKDKNGKKIFEWDKVKNSNGTIYTIMFDPAGYWCLDGNGYLNSEMLSENIKDIEVIGTIFDKEI